MIAMQANPARDKEAPAEVQGSREPRAAQPGDDAALQGAGHQPGRRLPADVPADAVPDRPVRHVIKGLTNTIKKTRSRTAVLPLSGEGRPGHRLADGDLKLARRPCQLVHACRQDKSCAPSPVTSRPPRRWPTTWWPPRGDEVVRAQPGLEALLTPLRLVGYIPYFALVAVAVALQYIQMSQMNKRNKALGPDNPQMQTMQKIMPIIFAYIYFLIPAAVVIYMIVSSPIRIVTQDIMFRTGIVQRPGEREIGGQGQKKPGGGWSRPAPSRSEVRRGRRRRTVERGDPTEAGGLQSRRSGADGWRGGKDRPAAGRRATGAGAGPTGRRPERAGPMEPARVVPTERPQAAPPVEGKTSKKGPLTRGVGGSHRQDPRGGQGVRARPAGGGREGRRGLVVAEPKTGLFGRMRSEARVRARVGRSDRVRSARGTRERDADRTTAARTGGRGGETPAAAAGRPTGP